MGEQKLKDDNRFVDLGSNVNGTNALDDEILPIKKVADTFRKLVRHL